LSEYKTGNALILAELEDYEKTILHFGEEGRLLTIEQIADCLRTKVLAGSTIHCVARTDKAYAPSLSISLIDGNIRYYHKLSELKDSLVECQCFPPESTQIVSYYSYVTENYVILFKAPGEGRYSDIDVRTVCTIVGEICEAVRNCSLQSKNLEQDAFLKKYEQLKRELELKSDYSLSDLCSFIRQTEGVSAASIYVADLDRMLVYDADYISGNPHRISECILNASSSEYKNRIRLLFVETISTGKALSGYVRDSGFSTFFVIVPVIRKIESPTRITRVLLIYQNQPIYSETVRFIIDYVDLFVSRAMTARKLDEILAVQQEVMNIPRLLATIKVASYSEFEQAFKRFLLPHLKEIVQATYAYSAVVRLYDPYQKALVIFDETSSEYGIRDNALAENDYRSIPLKQYKMSVNAFTFLDGGQKHDYVYIENLKAPIKERYHKSGLDTALTSRSRSLSEICFALLAGDVPFGTLNIESDVKGAFDDDVRYLLAVKRAIEAYYNNLLYSNDLQWIRSQINRYENIHELKSYASIGFFDKPTEQLLSKLLWLPPQKLEQLGRSGDYEPHALKDRVNHWIDQMYSGLSPENIQSVKSVLEYNIDENINMPTILFESIESIVKNLVQNIVRYGDQRRDKIIVSTRPFYDIGDQGIVRIYVRSHGKIGADTLDKFGLVPITDIVGNLHFGMFLVGMLTRILGGVLHVSRNEVAPYHVIEIRIPLTRRQA